MAQLSSMCPVCSDEECVTPLRVSGVHSSSRRTFYHPCIPSGLGRMGEGGSQGPAVLAAAAAAKVNVPAV